MTGCLPGTATPARAGELDPQHLRHRKRLTPWDPRPPKQSSSSMLLPFTSAKSPHVSLLSKMTTCHVLMVNNRDDLTEDFIHTIDMERHLSGGTNREEVLVRRQMKYTLDRKEIRQEREKGLFVYYVISGGGGGGGGGSSQT